MQHGMESCKRWDQHSTRAIKNMKTNEHPITMRATKSEKAAHSCGHGHFINIVWSEECDPTVLFPTRSFVLF